ncbi:Putative Synaptobrevin like YKT6 [Rhizopus microsporus]|uniref:Synaptobrevin homolog YKT6 n=1 Tax=Rhizopus microsporus TaxID=58291 RepID=A0A0A1NJC2_RHIZD|nr:snare-like protein [Rhizopus microsporus]CEI92639.1 Putative Synaptobrevin like YKT6 [Rhizopus microsporus]
MKIFAILVLRKDADKAKILTSQYDLSSFNFFQRGTVKEIMDFSATTITERTSLGQRQSVESENNVVHIYMHPQGASGIIISDKDYPTRVAFSLLNKIMDEVFTKYPQWKTSATIDYSELAEYISKYQDPQQADTIMKVQKELDETTAILHKTIDSVLQRGEKLDSLVDRSEALSAQSKMFYKTARKTNSCCVVM